MKKLTLLFAAILITSCGARKSEVKKTETEITQTTTEQQAIETETETVITDNTVIDTQEFVLEPVNNDKPIEVVKPDGSKIIVHNARIQSKKTKEQVNTKQELKEQVKQETQKSADTETKQSSKEKFTDRKAAFNWWWLLLLLILAAIYYRYKQAS